MITSRSSRILTFAEECVPTSICSSGRLRRSPPYRLKLNPPWHQSCWTESRLRLPQTHSPTFRLDLINFRPLWKTTNRSSRILTFAPEYLPKYSCSCHRFRKQDARCFKRCFEMHNWEIQMQ